MSPDVVAGRGDSRDPQVVKDDNTNVKEASGYKNEIGGLAAGEVRSTREINRLN